jgi:hypothetical protein
LTLTRPTFLIIADGDFAAMTSKTANSVIRYLPERVVGVLDRSQKGKTVQDVLGFGGTIPVLGSMAEGLRLGPTAVLIGIAPAGGKLPEEWRAWLAEALDAGCDIWSGLHTFIGDAAMLAAKARERGATILVVRRAPSNLPVADGVAGLVVGDGGLSVGGADRYRPRGRKAARGVAGLARRGAGCRLRYLVRAPYLLGLLPFARGKGPRARRHDPRRPAAAEQPSGRRRPGSARGAVRGVDRRH